MMQNTLITRDSKGKIRIVDITCVWEESINGYVINRSTSQYGGKEVLQPKIIIQKGKAGRTVTEQATLEYNSKVKKYKDKGYKELEKPIEQYTEQELQEFYGDVKVRDGSIIKPMLAKQAKDISKKTFDKQYYASRKINGVRCLIYCENGEIKTASRGATNYDLAIYHIISHPLLIEFFKNHSDAILDGEIYKWGYPLNKISGICRTQSTVDDGKDLQFYWYDIVDLKVPFVERYKCMQEWAKELLLPDFDPYREFSDENLHIQFLPQVEISGWDNMKKLHDEYVSKGWEGLVIRLAESVYKPGSRGNDWIKIKEYFDSTYKVVDYQLGLRGSEDMVFVCETAEGKRFNAMPMGDRATKEEYVENFDEKYRDHLGDCKYFEISEYGIPQQPKFIAFRYDLE